MIFGTVNTRLEPILPLRVYGPVVNDLVATVIDTGFTGELCLPAALVATLGLEFSHRGSSTLASGAVEKHGVYAAEVLWGNDLREVEVPAVGTEPLAGVALLAGHRLRVDFTVSGKVRVKPLA